MKLDLPQMRVQCPDLAVAESLRRVKWLVLCFEDLILGLGCLTAHFSYSSPKASLLPLFDPNILVILQPVTLTHSCTQVAHLNQDRTLPAPVQASPTKLSSF